MIRRSPTLYHVAKAFQSSLRTSRRAWWSARGRAAIRSYLESHDLRKLELGTGQFPTDGWLNTDVDPTTARVPNADGSVLIYLDATRRFPLADATFDYVYSEHMIEHLSYESARAMLAECFRVLRDGGRIRIATPDLARLLALYEDREHPTAGESAYLRWIAATMLGDANRATPPFVLNNAFRAWGHTFLYDEETLRTMFVEARFKNVRRYPVGESDDPELRGRERHGRVVENEEANEFETMVLEAEKQA